jgi:hypothetical protein
LGGYTGQNDAATVLIDCQNIASEKGGNHTIISNIFDADETEISTTVFDSTYFFCEYDQTRFRIFNHFLHRFCIVLVLRMTVKKNVMIHKNE